MDPVQTPATPAPPADVTITATRDAANRGDFGAFEKADSAAKAGKPLADIAAAPEKPAPAASTETTPAPAAAAAVDTPERQLSRRQQETNDRIREAVERTRATDAAEIARLRALVPDADRRTAPAAPAQPGIDPNDPPPDPSDTAKYPEERWDLKFLDDRAAWAARQENRRLQAADASAREHSTRIQSLEARDRQFNERLKAAKDADPQFITKLSADVRSLRPRDDLQPGERPTPLNDVADLILRSETPDRYMRHFSDHPEELARFAALPDPATVHFQFGLLHAQLHTDAKPAPTPTPKKLISDFTPPAPIVDKPQTSSDPKSAALARGDFATFDKLDMQERIAKRSPVSVTR